MISVTNVMTYDFCPRKLFMIKVMGIIPPQTDVMVQGTTKHKVLEKICAAEQNIVESITEIIDEQEVHEKYCSSFSSIAKKVIKNSRVADQSEEFLSIWPTINDLLPRPKGRGISCCG